MKRIAYTEWNEPRVVCPPEGGFPIERLREYAEMVRGSKPFTPHQICDVAKLLCDDALVDCLSSEDRYFMRRKFQPELNALLQAEAKKIRTLREFRKTAN